MEMYLDKLKKISKTTLIIFMVLQPIFDIYYLYLDKVREIFKFSPATIIRMVFMVFLIITSYLFMKKKIKKKYLISFITIYGLYSIFHLYNCTLFNSQIEFGYYSLSTEVFYLIRMICPLLLIFVTYQEDIKYNDIEKIMVIVYFIFGSIMVLTNFFGIALTSYNDGNKIISATFFDWFKPGIYQKYGYELIASKGIFHMANQVSGMMVGFFPLLLYIFLNNKLKVINVLTLFLTILSMFMLGTRIASLGMLLVIITVLILYTIFQIIGKKKFITKNVIVIIIFFILSLVIYKYAPVSNRYYASQESDSVMNNIKETGTDQKLVDLKAKLKGLTEEKQRELKLEFLEANKETYRFDTWFFETLYPYQKDPDFWFDILDIPYKDRCDHRQLKYLITKRVIELNNNKLDYVVGFSFARPRNATLYMENDILVHLYTIGILGIILFIAPYFLVALYAFYKMLKNKKKFTFLNICYLMCIGLIFLIGIMTGNIFDEWIVTLFLGFISGALLRSCK